MTNAADKIVAGLHRNGTRQLFCVPGIQNDVFFDALYNHGGIAPVHARHEQGAAYMALGAALATGLPQSYCVVPGPGFLNTTAALSTAYALQAPVLAMTGQIPSGAIGKGHGVLHEIPDQLSILRGLTRWAARIDSADRAGPLVEEAFARLRSPACGPVGLEVPMDVWATAADTAPEAGFGEGRAPALDAAALAAAARLLDGAERPMIVVGGGAQNAGAEVTALAEALQAPVMSFRNGQGVVDARHPLSVSLPGGRALWPEVDVVLGIGTRLQMQFTAWGTDARMKVIHLTADAAEIGRIRTPDIGLVCDAGEGAAALRDALNRRERPARSADIAATQQAARSDLHARLGPQMAYLDALRAVLPDDAILVDELTQVGYVSRFGWQAHRPRTYLSSGYQGTLGWGFATALGAKAARPDVPVVSISGDGGFLFTATELATAKRHGIAVIAIVFNDNAFGNVRRIQQQQYNGHTIATDLANPDFAAMARSFGLKGVHAGGPQALAQAVQQAMSEPEATVIEVPQGEVPDPFQYIFAPRLRG